MSENQSGGSSTIPLPGMNGGTANVSIPASEPPKAEDLPPQNEGKEVSQIQNNVEPEATAKEENSNTIIQKDGKAHELVIDLLEEKFIQLKEGKLEANELKEWFVKNPDLADTANRSKRIKEEYRDLMEKPVVTEAPKQTKASIPEEKPLTLKDLQAYDEEREAKLLLKAQQREQENLFKDFAVQHKVVDADAKQLKTNADALYKANPEWDYKQAVAMAYNTINPQKPSPMNVSTPSLNSMETKSSKVDATKGIQLISASKFSGGQLQD